MTREELDAVDRGPTEAELSEEVRLHELAAALTVKDTLEALTHGRSPSPVLTVAQVQRQLTAMFGDRVQHVTNGLIHSREEDA